MPSQMPEDPRSNWASLSQAARDDAYDNNKAVANSVALIAERNEASAKARAAYPAQLDVPYGPKERMKIDLYPAPDQSAPCLVFIHGGYWQRNSRELFAMMVEGVRSHGWHVAIPSHTLAPEASMTQIVAEIRMSLDWFAANRRTYGIGGPVILSGWSAGGHLTALMLDHPVVTAGLAISGVFDLAPIRDTGLNTALQLTDAEIAQFSPLRLPVVHKPLALAYGSQELGTLVWDSRNFHALRCGAGAPGRLVPVEGADHFTILEQLRRREGQLVDVVRALQG